MDCLISLCFVSSVYMTGGIGLQGYQYDYADPERTNDYGYQVGMAEVVLEFSNDLYMKAVHVSGLNTIEDDSGFNAIIIGAKIRFK